MTFETLSSPRPTARRCHRHAVRGAVALAALTLAGAAAAQVTFYERGGYAGRALTASGVFTDLQRQNFNDRAASAVVKAGEWEVCEDPHFRGRCVILRPGNYATLASTGLDRRISSVRPVAATPPAPVADSLTLYDRERFAGAAVTTDQSVMALERQGFNDRASSVVVHGGTWEICSDPRFGGRCVSLEPGQYPSLEAVGLDKRVSSVRKVDAPPLPPVAVRPGVTYYEFEGFRGRSYSTDQPVGNLDRSGFNGRAGSIDVAGGSWEVCEDPRFGGKCMILQPGGRYPTVASMGLSDRVASLREVDPRVAAAPLPAPPQPAYDPRARPNERLYQADVVSVREVRGPAEQRCWVEREPVTDARPRPNVPGAIAGAVIGGILGHQIGGGSGRDAATAVGAFGGAVAGANVNRNAPATQDVQRCSSSQAYGPPSYYDVIYNFRGMEHRVQMTSPPQATLTVNERGEPRV